MEPETRPAVFMGLVKVGIFIVVLAAAFFLCAGRLDLAMAWIYIAVIFVNTGITSLLMDPELIEERSGIGKDTKRWDIVPAVLMGRVGPLAFLIVAGLDVRFGWSPEMSLAVRIGAFGIALLGMLITDWAVVSNRFFSGVVRIQRERGHSVVITGPYRYVRHPGYAGAILHNMAEPVLLGSLWALVPAGLVAVVTIVRTAMEDRTLQEELEGYEPYAERVRYRLLPFLW
ncbi:MAG: isoprenylcysteine carboxylmethyltransferase family protein [Deltaproteobacteria bacterium]|nr:isoprenylcysteine carboxylmethyltransferase family protein [Deltaproteobacteria bacterium]